MLILICFDKQTHISSAPAQVLFSFKVSIDSFLLYADCSFLNTLGFVQRIGIGVLIVQKW